ncbi:MAG TPA: bifunctional UDP-N-acetylglucosamine diphosphorylase/glucosamine-1-phosphate N-acetyltransferase GlmU [Rhodospirillaceae bacterium]|nr:bifunctional UDP-N-acetylglucosamine diphosphorylase/glucosamine-1-phosphate N-acetyltransferase GlmU [Rhodospirillaceae bacterium]
MTDLSQPIPPLPAKDLAVVILAAGKGTRMKSAMSKVMHPIAGVPMIKHILTTAESLNPKKIIVVLAPAMDDVAKIAAPHSIAIQQQQLGTGDALKAAIHELGDFKGNILVLYGDVPLVSARTLNGLVAHHMNGQFGATVLAMVPPNATGYGRIFQNADGTLAKIVEEKDASDEEKLVRLSNSGLMVLDGDRLADTLLKLQNTNNQGEYYLVDVPQIMADEGRKSGVIRGDYAELRGVNTRAQLAELEMAWQHAKRIEMMEAGVTLLDPNTVYFAPDTVIGNDTVIGQHVVFGAGVTIASGVEIRAFCHIEGAVIQSGAVIGPFARLRPGADIGEDAKIGNFVEIKNAKIGTGAKANHLGYIGDAELGAHSNFGCGAITVNYDGRIKSKTIIGEHVMIGSNASLIAPITIADGAYVAAGSTLTHNVEQDALAIARARQEVLPNKGKNRLKKDH